MRSLYREYRTYVAINEYMDGKPRRRNAVKYGFLSWLDQFKVLQRTDECGCAKLGGGGRFYCSSEHFLGRLGVSDE